MSAQAQKSDIPKIRESGLKAIETKSATTFAARLHAVMAEQGHTQSSLAREIWGEKKTKGGAMVARNREQIRSYLKNGRVPRQKALAKLCDALGMEPTDLLQDGGLGKLGYTLPKNDLVITSMPDSSDVILQIHRRVSIETLGIVMKAIHAEQGEAI